VEKRDELYLKEFHEIEREMGECSAKDEERQLFLSVAKYRITE
jgi:hypothetical protein